MSGIQLILAVSLVIGGANCALLRMPLEKHDATGLQNVDHKYGSTASVDLISALGYSFYGYIAVGTPPQKFEVLFDTKDSLLWVKSSKCSLQYAACAFKIPKFDNSKSTTYKDAGSNFTYEEPYISGTLGYDNIGVGALTVPAQNFGEVIYLDDDYFGERSYNGIFGLARKSPENSTSVFDGMVKNGLLDEPVFSVYINRNKTLRGGGEILFGGTNKNHYQGEITYAPVTSDEWVVPLTTINIGSTTVCNNGCNALVDTASVGIYGPKDEIARINEAIGAAPLPGIPDIYFVDCSTLNDLPPLKINLNGKELVLEAKDYILPDIDLCTSLLVPSPDEDFWTLGYVFLGKYYTIFDASNDRIGFAESKYN